MIPLLRLDGARFPDNKEMKFSRIDPTGAGSPTILAEGRWEAPGVADVAPKALQRCASPSDHSMAPSPQPRSEILIRAVSRRQARTIYWSQALLSTGRRRLLSKSQTSDVRIHMAHIRPDVSNGHGRATQGNPAGSQLFSVFGRPRTDLRTVRYGTYTVSMDGADIYDPVTNTISANRSDKVAAWFVDTDYDARTFLHYNSIFPRRARWGNLAKALKGVVDETAFVLLAGTLSLPFPPGKHKTVAVKVIDPRGDNEVMSIHRLA